MLRMLSFPPTTSKAVENGVDLVLGVGINVSVCMRRLFGQVSGELRKFFIRCRTCRILHIWAWLKGVTLTVYGLT